MIKNIFAEFGSTNFLRLHVQDFRDATLHDEEGGVVHVQLNRTEEILNTLVVHVQAVDEVTVLAANDDLHNRGDPNLTCTCILILKYGGNECV